MTDEELTAAIREAQQRASSRSNIPSAGLDGVVQADLMPVVHARDAAEAKVAAIGTVNPRAGGLLNSVVQALKKGIARGLNWHVREQVEFNRSMIACIHSLIEACNELNHNISTLMVHHKQLSHDLDAKIRHINENLRGLNIEVQGYHQEAVELKDIRRNWSEWRESFEERRSAAEIHMLRTVSELQGAFQHRVTLLEQSLKQSILKQHADYAASLEKSTREVQQRLWKDLENIRAEYEKLIHSELKTLRQKQLALEHVAAPARSGSSNDAMPIDWMRFADRFRGSEERIKQQQAHYADCFKGAVGEVLDIGCGRGEFLDAAREAGLTAKGIDQSVESVGLCRAKGLNAELADLYSYLNGLPDRSLGGVYCSQVVEHLPADGVPRLAKLLGTKLRSGATVVIETPDPQCLAIFATHFYIDPTHTRPVPAPLMAFYLEESGFGNIRVERSSPAVESMPVLAELSSGVRDQFFGGLDYAIIAKRL